LPIQFLFLGYFLGKNNKFFGWDAVDALTNGDSWRDSGLVGGDTRWIRAKITLMTANFSSPESPSATSRLPAH
jgi:hypothetical protein